jgi:hypothetical protein
MAGIDINDSAVAGGQKAILVFDNILNIVLPVLISIASTIGALGLAGIGPLADTAKEWMTIGSGVTLAVSTAFLTVWNIIFPADKLKGTDTIKDANKTA